MRSQYTKSRTRLARIRCLSECLDAYKQLKPLPYALCYTCKDVIFKCSAQYMQSHSDIKTHAKPVSLFIGTGDETSLTESLQEVEHQRPGESGYTPGVDSATGLLKNVEQFNPSVWIKIRSSSSEESPYLEPLDQTHDVNCASSSDWKSNEDVCVNSWIGCVEATYSLSLSVKPTVSSADEETIDELRQVPPNWSHECDEQLVTVLQDSIELNNGNLGVIKNYVDEITVSTSCGDDNADNLVDGRGDTFWESDGSVGCHWIRLKMKKGTVISRLYATLDMEDDNYLPNHIIVSGGEPHDMKQLQDTRINLTSRGVKDECVLQSIKQHYPYIEIRIKSCKDEGIDTRIRGIKISSTKECDLGVTVDLFSDTEKLLRFPALQSQSKLVLYRRAQALQRLVSLLDSVINFIVPSWSENCTTLNLIQDVKQLLPLSTRRMPLIDAFIRESESSNNPATPRLMINRRLAMEHRQDPTVDPDGNNSVFSQIYEGLKMKDKALDYRWASQGQSEQWWECKFVAEGIIDQGGGFRDSISDMSEELCPANSDDPIPLQFFIRAPNQLNADSNTSRDMYVPNPSCTQFAKYRWIGKLMGACMRSVECIVLMLPEFIWKKLSGERVSWVPDYITVDAAEVRLLDSLEDMDEETYEIYCSERTWSVTLSDGSSHQLKPDGANSPVLYTDRLQYAEQARQARMTEFDQQIEAIREGFLSVIPGAILNLLTWREIEERVCGESEISIEGIRKCMHVDEMDSNDERVKMLIEVLTNFSNNDRSKFLRFITGRKRLPCPLYVSPYKSSAVDCLPESSTCSNTLYLPRYTSVKIAEEKLRYAAYNCIAIDTDLNPWE